MQPIPSGFKTILAAMLCTLLLTPNHSPAAGPATQPAFWAFAPTPPMGWNSYDAFGDSVTETEFLANAQYVHDHLLTHGWNYVIVDFRWYDPGAVSGDPNNRANAPLALDDFGRPQPAPNRFPSAATGKGFKPLADHVHAMGLKFGIHLMRGIPRLAVKLNTPIQGSNFHALDAANLFSTCSWCPDMFGVDAPQPAGQPWYDSLFRQYADWTVDFVKVDDLSRPYCTAEIQAIRNSIDRCGRTIVFSTSPGETPIAHAAHISTHANMWRLSDDFWDQWKFLNHSFDLLNKWQAYAGPGHWPDSDMLPLGHLAVRSIGKPRASLFTHDEQQTLISLWAIGSSPLMMGGDLTHNDDFTLSLLTNDPVLAIDQDPTPATRIMQDPQTQIEIWRKNLRNGDVAIAVFNRSPATQPTTLHLHDLSIPPMRTAKNLWTGQNFPKPSDKLNLSIPTHGVVLLQLHP